MHFKKSHLPLLSSKPSLKFKERLPFGTNAKSDKNNFAKTAF